MVTLRDELTTRDLLTVSKALRKLRPKVKGLVCVGVEVPQLNDKSVVFHVVSRNAEGNPEPSLILLSAEYLLEMFGGTDVGDEQEA
jgi:hypothetical protein